MMPRTKQVVVAAAQGTVNVRRLTLVLQREFGRVTIGEGEYMNGLPQNYIVLEEQ
jgi:hypothetical protein